MQVLQLHACLPAVEMSQFLKLRIRRLYLFGGCNENPLFKAYSSY